MSSASHTRSDYSGGDKVGPKEKWYDMHVFSRLFELASIDVDVRKDGIVQKREYYVIFNTIFGELFVHNLLSKNYDCVIKGGPKV